METEGIPCAGDRVRSQLRERWRFALQREAFDNGSRPPSPEMPPPALPLSSTSARRA